MKKMTSFLLLISFLFVPFSVSAFAAEPWLPVYREILNDLLVRFSEQTRNDAAIECSYLIYDIDHDGVPELLTKTGTCEADYMATIYTFRNGQAAKVDEIGAGHTAFYGDYSLGGLISYMGHMGYASVGIYRLENGQLSYEHLFEDDLNVRLEKDPDAEYLPVTDYVPGAVYLTLVDADNPLPLTHYEEICSLMKGVFPVSDECYFPNHDAVFFDRIIDDNAPVYAISTDRFGNCPGSVNFQDLLKKDVAAPWMSGDLLISAMQAADLNGDGKLECILTLSAADGGSPMHFYMTEQDGSVFVYLQNYAYDTVTADRNGSLLFESDYFTELRRLVFDRDACLLLSLPLAFTAA